jgi:hypothetical protein
MRTLTKLLGAFAFSAVLAVGANAAHPKEIKKVTAIDPETGLIVNTGVETVKANCTVCHSAKFILLQRGDRKTWKDMIVWMQQTQGLWEFDPETEKTILDYLATNYAPDDKIERRKNLSPASRPNNPYAAK